MDRHGAAQHYWAGNDSSQHTCQCGRDKNCTYFHTFNYVCNCNAGIPTWLEDGGYITNKTALPVSELYFGNTNYALQDAKHTLGTLQCTGKSQVVPGSSCYALRRQGVTVSGYYAVRNNQSSIPDIVLCDMTKSPSDSAFQTTLGHPGDLRQSVIFDAFRSSNVRDAGIVNYQHISVNIGEGLDPHSGIFTAPYSGLYMMAFHISTHTNLAWNSLYIHVNGQEAGSAHLEHTNDMLSQFILVNLNQGDTVWIFNLEGTNFIDLSEYIIHFTGMLLHLKQV